jgi:hypothetical protein
MSDVRIKFDDNSLANEHGAEKFITLKPRCESIVRLPKVSDKM